MSAVRVNKIGFLSMRTADVDALVDYYTRVIGLQETAREGSVAYLTTGSDHHALVISKGDPDGRAGLGFEAHGDLDDAEKGLRAAGLEVERRSDPEPGVADAVTVTEPLTATPIALFGSQSGSGLEPGLGPRPTKLGHVAAYVPDLGPVRAFWEGQLGFVFADMIGDFFVFLRCNPDHHTVNLMASGKRSGLHHSAFEVRDFMHLKEMLDHLAHHEVRLEWGPGRHGAGHNIFTYHRDPDGNVVELFTELDVVHDEDSGNWEPRPWHEEFPQGPKTWEPSPGAANKWGPINPEMLDH
jgi:catechol-2,3-dioxygenase